MEASTKDERSRSIAPNPVVVTSVKLKDDLLFSFCRCSDRGRFLVIIREYNGKIRIQQRCCCFDDIVLNFKTDDVEG